jgi:hypothetical protein
MVILKSGLDATNQQTPKNYLISLQIFRFLKMIHNRLAEPKPLKDIFFRFLSKKWWVQNFINFTENFFRTENFY